MMEIGRLPVPNVAKLVLISYSVKVGYSIVFAGPASWLVKVIKRRTGIDVYDFPTAVTPFKYKKPED